jgi:hypothetical protein
VRAIPGAEPPSGPPADLNPGSWNKCVLSFSYILNHSLFSSLLAAQLTVCPIFPLILCGYSLTRLQTLFNREIIATLLIPSTYIYPDRIFGMLLLTERLNPGSTSPSATLSAGTPKSPQPAVVCNFSPSYNRCLADYRPALKQI